MPFLKNIQFTRLLKINSQLKEFNFRKSNATPDTLFTIDTSGDKGNRITFHMHKVGEQWKMVELNMPTWITDSEPLLEQAIIEEMSVCEKQFSIPAASGSYLSFHRLFSLFGVG